LSQIILNEGITVIPEEKAMEPIVQNENKSAAEPELVHNKPESPLSPVPVENPFGNFDINQPVDNSVVPMQLPAPEFLSGADSVFYTGDIMLWSEAMSLLSVEEQSQQEVSTRTAPCFIYPSPSVREDVIKSRPAWIEALRLKSAMAASASAFDASWEEVIVSATMEDEEGVRTALALAFQHKAELEALQARFSDIPKIVKEAGEP